MNFNLSKLGNYTVESLVQQGLDSLLNLQSKGENKEINAKGKIQLIKKSLDQKGELYRLPPSQDFTLSALQIRYSTSPGAIIVTLDNLRSFHKFLTQKILEYAETGKLQKADKYLHQKRNIDIHNYTHRLKIYRVTESKAKILVWIIDLDLHKETSDEQSYGSGTAKIMIQDLMINLLDEPDAKASRRDYLNVLVNQDWISHIRRIAQPFYNHSQLSYKVIYHQPLRHQVIQTVSS